MEIKYSDMNELMMEQGFTQIFTNPLYPVLAMGLILLIGYIGSVSLSVSEGSLPQK